MIISKTSTLSSSLWTMPFCFASSLFGFKVICFDNFSTMSTHYFCVICQVDPSMESSIAVLCNEPYVYKNFNLKNNSLQTHCQDGIVFLVQNKFVCSAQLSLRMRIVFPVAPFPTLNEFSEVIFAPDKTVQS